MTQGAPRGGIYYGWVILGLGIVGSMSAAGMTFWAVTIYIPTLVEDLDASRTQVALTFTVGNVVGAIIGPFAGRWMDARGAKETILVGTAVIATALLITSRSTTLWQIFIGWTAVSAVRPLLLPNAYSWLLTRWFDRRRQMALGLLTAGFGLSGAVAIPLLSFLESIGGWPLVMAVSGVVLLAVNGGTTLLFVFDRPADRGLSVEGAHEGPGAPAPTEEPGFTVREAMRTPVFWTLSVGFMLLFIGPAAFGLLQLDFFRDRGVDHAVTVIFFAALFRGLARLPLGFLFGRIDRLFSLAVVVALSQGVAVMALVLSTSLPSIAVFIVLWAAFGAFVPMLEPGMISKTFGVKHFGAIMGVVQMVAFWGSLIGPVGAGWLRDTTGSYDVAFSLFALALAAAALLFAASSVLVRRPAHRAAAARAGLPVERGARGSVRRLLL